MASGKLVIGTRRYSSWSLRGWLAVRLAGLDVADEVIQLAAGPTPALLAATPSGLVPYLEHDGARIWDSLAICEYCAELEPRMWPEARVARAEARSMAAEMHSGFRALRLAMPMNLGRDYAGRARTPETLVDIARIELIWKNARDLYGAGGPYLFGATFGAVDAMFAPVVARFLTYRPDLSSASRAYCAAVREHRLVSEWYDLAAAEPAGWLLDKYETVPA